MAGSAPPLHRDRLLFRSPVIQVGDFRSEPTHPQFAASSATTGYCFVFPRNAVWIQHEGCQPFVADSNVVPLYNAGHAYRRRQIGSEGDRTDWFSVTPGILRQMLRTVDPRAADADSRLFRFEFGRVAARTFLKQRQVFMHVRSTGTPDKLFVEESVIGVLDELLTNIYGALAEAPTRTQRDLAEDARACLNLTFATQNGIHELAGAVGTSVSHLCRIFRQHSGSTIHRYRNELRLRRSLELLVDDDDILTVAIALGYAGHSHFTRAFHAAFGVTPSRFRDLSSVRRVELRRTCAGHRSLRRIVPGAQ